MEGELFDRKIMEQLTAGALRRACRSKGAQEDFLDPESGRDPTMGVAKQSRRLLVNSHLGANEVLIVLSANRVLINRSCVLRKGQILGSG